MFGSRVPHPRKQQQRRQRRLHQSGKIGTRGSGGRRIRSAPQRLKRTVCLGDRAGRCRRRQQPRPPPPIHPRAAAHWSSAATYKVRGKHAAVSDRRSSSPVLSAGAGRAKRVRRRTRREMRHGRRTRRGAAALSRADGRTRGGGRGISGGPILSRLPAVGQLPRGRRREKVAGRR